MIEQSLFSVKEIPAIGKFPDNMNYTKEPTKQTGYKFIMREDTGQVLSCMTDEYKLIPNQEIIDTAVPILKQHKANPVVLYLGKYHAMHGYAVPLLSHSQMLD